MTADAWITLGIVVVTMVALASERIPPVVAMVGANVALLLFGVLDERNAFLGFANSAPITIAGLYVLAGAAERTGALASLTERALGPSRPSSEQRALTRVVLPTTAVSSVIANTPLVSLLAPRVTTWAERGGQSANRYLMPLSYAAILGGVITVVGTSTNLVISGLLEASDLEPLSLFEITPVGLPVAAAGAALLILVAPSLLPKRASVVDELQRTAREFTLEVIVEPGSSLVGKTVTEAGLRQLEGVFLVGLERGEETIAPVAPDHELAADDRLTFAGNVTKVLDLQRMTGLRFAEQRHYDVLGAGPDRRIFEVVVGERSVLVGSTIREIGFRNRYEAAVLAVHRAAHRVEGKIGDVRIRPGDVLLVVADPGFAERWRDRNDFLVVADAPGAAPLRKDRVRIVELTTILFVVVSALGWLSLLEASLLAAMAMVGLRVISPTEARQSINLNVIVIMATSISIGTAVATSGLAEVAARRVLEITDGLGEIGILAGILLATMIMTELLSNNAAAALMLPIGLATAQQADLEPRAFAVTVLMGASLTFLTPIGYQTNTMVYGMGGYRFLDFTRLGFPLSGLVFVGVLALVPLFFPLSP